MTRFKPAGHGWLARRASPETIAEAKARMAAWNERPNTRVWTGQIWVGELVEKALACLLDELRVNHTWHGGDEHFTGPDFHVCGTAVGVKGRASRERWHLARGVLIPHQHRDRETEDEFFFGAVEGDERVLLLGGISRARFFEEARDVAEGDRLDYGAGGRAQNACFELPTARLETPADWLSRLFAGQMATLA